MKKTSKLFTRDFIRGTVLSFTILTSLGASFAFAQGVDSSIRTQADIEANAPTDRNPNRYRDLTGSTRQRQVIDAETRTNVDSFGDRNIDPAAGVDQRTVIEDWGRDSDHDPRVEGNHERERELKPSSKNRVKSNVNANTNTQDNLDAVTGVNNNIDLEARTNVGINADAGVLGVGNTDLDGSNSNSGRTAGGGILGTNGTNPNARKSVGGR